MDSGVVLGVVLGWLNLGTLGIMGWDKLQARRGRRRVSERNLFLLALVGGAVGCLGGMYVFRHKTKHRRFVWGMPAIALLQGALALAVFCA